MWLKNTWKRIPYLHEQHELRSLGKGGTTEYLLLGIQAIFLKLTRYFYINISKIF